MIQLLNDSQELTDRAVANETVASLTAAEIESMSNQALVELIRVALRNSGLVDRFALEMYDRQTLITIAFLGRRCCQNLVRLFPHR